MTLKTDNFTGADGQLLTARTDWSQRGSGTCRAVVNASNQIKSVGGGDGSTVCVDTGSNDMYAQCVGLSDFGTNDGWPLAVRVTDRNAYIAGRWNSVDSLWEIHTQFGRVTSAAGSFTSGDVIRLEIVGDVATLKKNGITVLTDTVPSITASNYAGMFLRIAKDPVLDDWQSDSIGGTDTTIPTLSGTITEVSKTTNSISISWPAGADNVAVTSYEVSNNAGSSYTDVGNVLAHTFTGLTASTAYALRVRAKDAAGNVSTPALALSVTTLAPDSTLPTMNGSITVGTKTSNSISISYPAASDNVAVTGYEVSSNGGSTWSDNGTALSYTFLGLSPITSYNLRVRAYDGAGNRAATPLAATASTYRLGDLASNVIANTAPGSGSAAGWLYDLALTSAGTDWLSYVILSGPTPGGGTLVNNPDGSSSYTGPDAATLTIQRYVNDTAESGTTLITLYDQGLTAAIAGTSAVIWNLTGAVNVTLGSVQTADVAGTSTVVWSLTGSVSATVEAPALETAIASVAAQSAVVWQLTGAVNASVLPATTPPTGLQYLSIAGASPYDQYVSEADGVSITNRLPKQPREVKWFVVSFAEWLALLGDTPRAADPIEFDAAPAGLDLIEWSFDTETKRVNFQIGGGDDRLKYPLTMWMNTETGQRLEHQVAIRVREIR